VNAAEVVGRTLAELGVRDAFGVLGSGNFIATLSMHASGVAFHHARHEGGAICMADGYARVSGRVGVCSVHQGPGFTNAMTGLTEAAKARTPLLLIAGEAPAAALRSNFRLDQAGLAETVGAVAERVHSGESAAADTTRAFRRAEVERRPVLLSMPLDVQEQPAPGTSPPPASSTDTDSSAAAASSVGARLHRPAPSPAAIAEVADLIAGARRPLILAGRGAVLSDAREPLEALGDAIGAVLATSAMGHGIFAGSPWAVGISGGFASPLAARLISSSDLILAFGAALTRWTTKDGSLISPDARVVHVDVEADAAHRPVDVAVIGDAAATARALLDAGVRNLGVRDDALAAEIAAGSWRDEPYVDARIAGRMDPARSRSPWTRCCPRSAPLPSTPATSWASRRCTCACPTRRASCSPRRSSRSRSAWRPGSARRSRGRIG
jgi:thiamine pyrophosphate-dependent acetolactate synthase large subunit-like protein